MTSRRVLVTGATGFVGRTLVRQLRDAGYDVVGTTTRSNQGDTLTCDITNSTDVTAVLQAVQPEIVFHCAAISSVTSGAPIDYYKTNVMGTEHILSAIRQLEHRVRLIFLSTAGVYGNQSVETLAEMLPPCPVHHYGISKFAGERLVENHTDTVDFTIVRPFNIIGAGQDESFIVPKLINAFSRGDREIRIGNIDVYRDYIDLETTCDTLVRMIDRTSCLSEIVNLCTGKGTSLRTLISHMQHICGYQITIVPAPEFMRKNEVWRMFGSRAKLQMLLPDAPLPLPLRSVLQAMLEVKKKKQEAEI